MGLSICFTVYNQLDILRKRLDSIIICKDKNIEIVISDDCSTDNIKGLIQSYNDNRIKYFKTKNNLGHDLNILHGIEHCSFDYIMLLRTRDNINITTIKEIQKLINKYPMAGLYYTSALDENGKERLKFKDECFDCGVKSAKAHFTLPIHPSGIIYNKTQLNIPLYKMYIEKYFDNRYAFLVHQLIRCDVSSKADIITSNINGWIYTHTLKETDVAVNSAQNKENVYAPKYCFQRYKCEFMFANNEISDPIKISYLKYIIKFYYYFVSYRSRAICGDKRYAQHYAAKVEKLKLNEILISLRQLTDTLITKTSGIDKKVLYKLEKREEFKAKTYLRCKLLIRNMLVYLVYR